jgi:cytochrome c biogenesis protein CcmG, thiol:disulfide interchange protein DsbE
MLHAMSFSNGTTTRRAFLAAAGATLLSGCAPSTGPRILPMHGLPRISGLRAPGIAERQFIGVVSVVNVFASWCGPCRGEMPILMRLSQRWSGFAVIGLAQSDKEENVAAFLERGCPFRAVSMIDRDYWHALDGSGIPRTYLVDRAGAATLFRYGELRDADLEAELLPALRTLRERAA